MTTEFVADLGKFKTLTLQNMKYVAVESIQDVMEAAQTPQMGVERTGGSFEIGKIPVVEADLINSLVSDGIGGAESYSVALAGLALGDVMKFEWTSDHALPIEAGTQRIAGRHFVGANAERFSEFVKRRAAEVKR